MTCFATSTRARNGYLYVKKKSSYAPSVCCNGSAGCSISVLLSYFCKNVFICATFRPHMISIWHTLEHKISMRKNSHIKHYKYMIKILSIFTGWWCGKHDGKGTKTSQGMREGRIYRLSTLRFIPGGDEISKVLFLASSTDMCHRFKRAQ